MHNLCTALVCEVVLWSVGSLYYKIFIFLCLEKCISSLQHQKRNQFTIFWYLSNKYIAFSFFLYVVILKGIRILLVGCFYFFVCSVILFTLRSVSSSVYSEIILTCGFCHRILYLLRTETYDLRRYAWYCTYNLGNYERGMKVSSLHLKLIFK